MQGMNKNAPQSYLWYVEDAFLWNNAADARIFAKESDYGFRDYSPVHARFITEDPIRDGENWFAYVGNNPVNWVDPWGLSASENQKNTNKFGSELKDIGKKTD